MSTCFVDDCMQDIIEELYDNGEEDEITYESENEWEVTGYVVEKLLNMLKQHKNGNEIIDKEWKEDCINSKGEPFDMKTQIYSIEVF